MDAEAEVKLEPVEVIDEELQNNGTATDGSSFGEDFDMADSILVTVSADAKKVKEAKIEAGDPMSSAGSSNAEKENAVPNANKAVGGDNDGDVAHAPRKTMPELARVRPPVAPRRNQANLMTMSMADWSTQLNPGATAAALNVPGVGKPGDSDEVRALKNEVMTLKEEVAVLRQQQQSTVGLRKDYDRLNADLSKMAAEWAAFKKQSADAAEQQKKNFDAQYKKLVEEFKKACQKLVSDFAPVRTEVNDVAARATEFERKFDKLSKDFDEERKLTWETKRGLEIVRNIVVQEHSSHTWIIPDFHGFLQGGVVVRSKDIRTSMYWGYKLAGLVYPNGVGAGRDTHLSVGWTLLASEHDDYLEWPFKGVVVFKILPPSGSNALPLIAETVPGGEDGTYSSPAFQRPGFPDVVEPDCVEGIERFVELRTLCQDYVAGDGKLVIEVSVYPSRD